MRAVAFALILVIALAEMWASEHGTPNASLPIVQASDSAPAVRLNSVCWADRFPIVKKDDA
jgi:hypothetical protein